MFTEFARFGTSAEKRQNRFHFTALTEGKLMLGNVINMVTDILYCLSARRTGTTSGQRE